MCGARRFVILFQPMGYSDNNLDACTGVLSLFALQETVRSRIGSLSVWVKAEVAECKRAAAGHFYLTFVEKSAPPASAEVARASGQIWSSRAGIVEAFRRETGLVLSAGMTILFHCTVRYSARWGLGLDVDAIDASFSLGRRERERRETLEYLSRSGLLALQKGLPLPYFPGRIAVISSESAAGWGDFVRHMESNGRGYRLDYELLPAVMQGDSAPSSIICALGYAVDDGADVIVILRGGGADSDMFCFDDRALCEAICRCPVPVFCAVGHEKDHHICDDAAFGSERTPTAMADMLVGWVARCEDEVEALRVSVVRAAASWLGSEDAVVGRMLSSVRRGLAEAVRAEEVGVMSVLRFLGQALGRRVRSLEQEAEGCRRAVVSSAGKRVLSDEAAVGSVRDAVSFAARMIIKDKDAAVSAIGDRVSAADPRKILELGYALAVDEGGRILKGVSSREAGERFRLRHLDGFWGCVVEETKKY